MAGKNEQISLKISETTKKPSSKRGVNNKQLTNNNKSNAETDRIKDIARSVARTEAARTAKGSINSASLASLVAQQREKATATAAILDSLADPWNSDVVRFSRGNQRPTAVSKSHTVIPTPWATIGPKTSKQAMSVSENIIILFRDPRRAIIYYDPNMLGQSWQYYCYFQGATGQVNNYTRLSANPDFNIAYALCQTTYAPHGAQLWPGMDESGERYIWIDSPDASSTVAFGTGGTLPATENVLQVFIYTHGIVEEQAQIEFTTTSYTYSVPKSGYYRFTLQNAVDPGGVNNYSVIISGTCSVFCHLEAPDFSTNLAKLQKARILGMGLLTSNYANGQTVQGQIIQAQLDGSADWMQSIQMSDTGNILSGALFTYLNSLPPYMMDMKNLDNGAYGYAKLTDPIDVEFRDIDAELNSSATPLYSNVPLPYRLDDDSDYFVCHLSSTNATVQNSLWAVAFGMELVTTNTWMETKFAGVCPTSCDDIIYYLASQPQFSENPFHISDILKYAKTHVLPIAGKIVSGLSSIIPHPGVRSAGLLVGGGLEVLNGVINPAKTTSRRRKKR